MADFSYGVIAAVGVLVAISLVFVMDSPDEVVGERVADFVLIPEPVPMPSLPPPSEDVVVEVEPPEPVVVVMGEGTSVPGCEADDSCYVPYDVMIEGGTTVTWRNDDAAAHTVSSGSPVAGMSGVFDSGLMPAGGTFDHAFEEAGTYDYFCVVHPWMVGTVTVS